MIATVRQVSQAIGIAAAGTLYAVFHARHVAELTAGGVPADIAARQAAALSFQEVLTITLFSLVAAVVFSALRGPDRTTEAEEEDAPIGARAAMPSRH
jgi:hypothetical protein